MSAYAAGSVAIYKSIQNVAFSVAPTGGAQNAVITAVTTAKVVVQNSGPANATSNARIATIYNNVTTPTNLQYLVFCTTNSDTITGFINVLETF